MAHSDSASSVITWDPSVWDSVSSITEQLLALPEPVLQRIVSHFHLQEILAAPVELLKQWLRHIEASGGVLDMHCLKASLGWEQAFVELLSRLWRLLSALEITDLVLPADPTCWCGRESSAAMGKILEHLCRAELPVASSVTAIQFHVFTTPEHLNTFLSLVPNVKSVEPHCFSVLYPYPELQGTRPDQKRNLAAVNDIARLLPQLQSLQAVHVRLGRVQNKRGQQAYTAFVGSLQQCTALTELWLDIERDDLDYKIPDTLEALPSALSTLQKFRLNVQLDAPFEVARIRAQVAVLSGYSSLSSLSLYFCTFQQTPDAPVNSSPSVEVILSVLGEVLQPLKLLRHLCLDTTLLSRRKQRQCTRDAVASFIGILKMLDSFELDGSLMYMLLPVVPSVSVVQSLCCRDSDIKAVSDAQGVPSLDISSLSVLTGLTRLSLPDWKQHADVDLGLAGVLKCLPDLRVLDITSGSEGDIEARSILPHVVALSKLERFSYVMCDWGGSDCVGWKELAKAEMLLMADSLTHLTLRSDNGGHEFPGIVLKEDVPQFYSVLVRLTALRELSVDVLPLHSATWFTSLALLKDLEQLSFEAGNYNDGVDMDLLESDVEDVGVAIGSLTKLRLLKLAAFSVTSTVIADVFAAHLTGLCQLRSVDVSFRLADHEDGDEKDASHDAMKASGARQCCGAHVPVTALQRGW